MAAVRVADVWSPARIILTFSDFKSLILYGGPSPPLSAWTDPVGLVPVELVLSTGIPATVSIPVIPARQLQYRFLEGKTGPVVKNR
jgi:hypothetical protein